MDVRGWFRDSIHNVKKDGVSGIREALHPAYKKGLHQVFRFTESGTPIYEQEWDLLIVLDACRVDLMEEVDNDFDFITRIETIRSVDTMTREWMKKNFQEKYEEEMASTAFICGNPHSEQFLNSDDFFSLEEVWRYAWDNEVGTLPPRPLTDRAIEIARSESPPRMIVHYMQPHYPFITVPELDYGIDIDQFGELPWDNVWERLRNGGLDKSEVWNGYRENLQYVLRDIGLLLENIDAKKAVITSDHGNAIGEWGIYGHPIHMPIDAIQIVPWVETTATDTQTHDPSDHVKRDIDESLEDRLVQLGYK